MSIPKLFSTCLFILSLTFHLSHASNDIDPGKVLSGAEITDAVRNIATELNTTYLFPDNAKAASEALIVALNTGKFSQEFTFERFKHVVESLLFQHTGDSGFELLQRMNNFSGTTPDKSDFSSAITTEKLDNNIVVLAFSGDFSYSGVEQDVQRAMDSLTDATALIIDLTDTDEGSIAVSQLIASYFLKPGTLIADVRANENLPVTQLYSLDVKGSVHFKDDFPVYIVNSPFVTGAWEFLGYTLKHFDKAEIVGKNSIGMGHLKSLLQVSEHISLRLNTAQITHPITETNWHEVGVIADHLSDEYETLGLAIKLALAELSNSELGVVK